MVSLYFHNSAFIVESRWLLCLNTRLYLVDARTGVDVGEIDECRWAGVAESSPNARLSKFQTLRLPRVERAVLARDLLDIKGAWRWLSGPAWSA